MKTIKKILAVALTLAMVLTIAPVFNSSVKAGDGTDLKPITNGTNADGSVYISNTSVYYGTTSYIGINGTNTTYFGATTTKSDNCKIWLYSESSAPSTPSTPTDNKYTSYTAVSGNTPVADGDYVLLNTTSNVLVTGTPATNGSIYGISKVDASGSVSADKTTLETTADNIYTFTRQSSGKYYVQHKTSQKYLKISGGNNVTLVDSPYALNIAVNTNGEIGLYNDNLDFLDYFAGNGQLFSAWNPGSVDPTGNRAYRLYSAPKASEPSEPSDPSVPVSGAKADLYKAMMSGLEVDLSPFTKASCEKLLEALEAGIVLYNDPNATDADVRAATAAILAAIEALDMDIKQIKGTLFKYGYSNADGFSDYSDGGLLMNDIIVDQMKTAILADKNLVDQIKNIIGYDTVAWEDGYADDAYYLGCHRSVSFLFAFNGRACRGLPLQQRTQ